jgi:hypothetical protein
MTMLRAGSVIRKDLNTSGRVLSVGATTATLVAGQGANFAVGDVVIVAGNAGGEGANFPLPVYFEPTMQFNYLQEVNHAYEVTRWMTTEARYDAMNGSLMQKERKDVLFYHKINVNLALWFGHLESGTDASANQVLGTKGVLETIVTNYGTFQGGVVTFAQLRQAVGDYTLKSPSKEIDLYIAPDVWALLDDLWFGKQQISAPVITEAGVAMRKIELGPKTLRIIQCVAFQSGTKFGNLMVGIDPKYYEIKTGRDQGSKRVQWMLEYTQKPEELGAQLTKQTFVSDIGSNLAAEEAHFILDNAVSVA